VTIASHRVIRLRGTWVRGRATAVSPREHPWGSDDQAYVRANGATTSRGWSDEIRRKMNHATTIIATGQGKLITVIMVESWTPTASASELRQPATAMAA
jgi:hypothetical protein